MNGMKTNLRSVVSQGFPWSKNSGNKGRNYYKQSWPPIMCVWCLTSRRGIMSRKFVIAKIFGWLKFGKSISIHQICLIFLAPKLPSVRYSKTTCNQTYMSNTVHISIAINTLCTFTWPIYTIKYKVTLESQVTKLQIGFINMQPEKQEVWFTIIAAVLVH